MTNQNIRYPIATETNPRAYIARVFNNANQDAIQQLERYFGKADPETQHFRDQCKDLGFSVVFSQGLSDKEVLDILRSPETTRILASS